MNEYDIEKRMAERKAKREKALHKKQMLIQKLVAVGMVIFCGLVILLASKCTTPEEKDASIVVILLPMAISLFFSKEYVLML